MLIDAYLNKLYQFHASESVHDTDAITETYGEILSPSIAQLLTKVPLTENDVFIDFGSGVGKAVLQVFLHSPVKEAIGIEILPALHQKAIEAAAQMQRDWPAFFTGHRELNFILDNFLTMPLTDYSLSAATYALITSSCFSASMMYQLGQLIDKMPNVHTVLTLRPLNTLRLRFKQMIRVECSWDSALCYVYSR